MSYLYRTTFIPGAAEAMIVAGLKQTAFRVVHTYARFRLIFFSTCLMSQMAQIDFSRRSRHWLQLHAPANKIGASTMTSSSALFNDWADHASHCVLVVNTLSGVESENLTLQVVERLEISVHHTISYFAPRIFHCSHGASLLQATTGQAASHLSVGNQQLATRK